MDWVVRAGKYDKETLTDRQRRISNCKYRISKATSNNIEKAVRKFARLNYRLFGKRPWDTRREVLNKEVDLTPEKVVDHDNAKSNQLKQNVEQAYKFLEQEQERVKNYEAV